jgi:DNA polymerase I-like protein with 3'-5' exonuclease and polymerase domains
MKFEEIIKKQEKYGFKFDVKQAQQLHIKLLNDIYEIDADKDTINRRMTLLLSLIEYAENDKNNRIHSHHKINGSITKRISHSNPNISSIPSKNSLYGKEFRQLFIVEDNKVLLGIDASNIELRLLAHYMDDEKYIEQIYFGDIHNYNRDKAELKDRNQAKTFIYAFLYGIGDLNLGKKLSNNKTDEEYKKIGKDIKKKFLENLPKLNKLKNKIESNNNIELLNGEIIKSEESYKNLNLLLQSASSIIMIKMLELFNSKLRANCIKYNFVANIHDEIQIEIFEKDKELVSKLGKESLIESGEYYNLKIKLDSEVNIGKNWYETH